MSEQNLLNLEDKSCKIVKEILNNHGSLSRLQDSISTDIKSVISILEKMYSLNYTKTGKKRKNTNAVTTKKIELIHASNDIDLILSIKKIMWNELTFEQCVYSVSDMLLINLVLYKYELMTITDYKNFWHLLYKNNLVDNEDQVLYLYAQVDDRLEDLNSWMNYILDSSYEMGTAIPSLEKTIELYGEVDDDMKEVVHKVNSIISRPEFIKEIIENTTIDILSKVVHWTPYKSIITEYLVSKELENIEGLNNHDDVSKVINQRDKITEDMPVSYSVLGNKIGEFTAQTIDMDLYSKLPQAHLQSWLPKWVYSHPEVDPKIKLFFPGGDGIGHSAIIVKTNEGMILLDFGLSVVNNTSPKWLPLLNKLDAVLLTHAHMDHSGSIPLLYDHHRDLQWFATKETKFMVDMLWGDTQRIISRHTHDDILASDPVIQKLTNKDNVMRASKNFNEINIKSTFSVLPNVEVTAHHAGHLFGSVGYELNIAGKRIFYSGDFNKNGTPLLDKSEFPNDFDYTIFDGTNYNRYHEESTLESNFENILNNSDRIIIPAFSIGRTQEMLYQLKQTKGIDNWNITLTGMGGRLTKHMSIKKLDNSLKNVSIKPTLPTTEFIEKTIVIAGQGMLQAGTSRNLFEFSKDDERTTVAFTGYQAPNTMGAQILFNNRYLKNKFKQQVARIKFSGHTSGKDLDKYIDEQAGNKIMVHSPDGAYESMKKEDIQIPSSFRRKLDI